MRFGGPRRRGALGVNITPLIDLMFLLVIFILIAAQFTPEAGVAIDLPSGGIEGAGEPRVWVLAITAGGDLFFEREPVTLEQFRAKLASLKTEAGAAGHPRALRFDADRRAPFGVFAAALAEAKRVGNLRVQVNMLAR